jgi:hypothetical protein
MKKNLLFVIIIFFVLVSKSQVVLNEVYPEPANGKSEFFELYNTSVSGSPQSMDHYTIVTFFQTPSEEGFYVMDLPNLFVSPKGFFVGAASLPFSYQGVTNSTAADFSWNSSALTSNNGYIKKWKYQNNNLSDGNLYYDEVPLPSNFNDFFQRRTGVGSTYTIFLYKDGNLINAVCLGTGGAADVLPSIINMPSLYIDMSGSSPDFTIDFSNYGSVPVESVSQDAGSDNGYIRVRDGLCGGWTKSSSQVQHTPQLSNGNVDGSLGTVSATAIIQKGTIQGGSSFIYDVIAAPSTSFPIELQVYKDNGSSILSLDGGDEYVESNFETVLSDGPFTTIFTPYDMNMLLVIKTNAGCIDKVLYAINSGILPVRLIYFNGNLSGDITKLEWKIAQNEAAKFFEIQTSTDGINFITAATINSSGKQGEGQYNYSMNASAKKLYYRLRIVGVDQTVNYSGIISVGYKNNGKNNFSILQNPTTDVLKLQLNSISNQSIDIKVYDISGRLRLEEKLMISEGRNLISLQKTSGLSLGTYVVEVNSANEKFVEKFIKQ